MHIVLGVVSAVAGLIWALVALQRSGFNPDSLNPFLWYRRSQWRKKYGTRPIYNLENPIDVAAVLILGTAKCEGEFSSGQKQAIQSLFENEFGLDHDEACDLLLASTHLIRDEIYLVDNLDKILMKSGAYFTIEQARSLIAMMLRVGTLESAINEEQRKLIAATENHFARLDVAPGKWQ